MKRAWRQVGIWCVVALVGGGCALKLSQRSPWDIEQIERLSQELERFRSLAQLNAEEANRLREAKAQLERGLGSNQGVSIVDLDEPARSAFKQAVRSVIEQSYSNLPCELLGLLGGAGAVLRRRETC